MTAIRLEKFANPVLPGNGTRLISLAEIVAIKQEAREEGIRQGAAAATQAFKTEQSQSISQIKEAINDSNLVREEAHRLAVGSLQGLIKTITKTLAPVAASTSLTEEIMRIASAAASKIDTYEVIVFVSCKRLEAVQDIFGKTLTVKTDDTLSGDQARVEWNDGYDFIDIAATEQALNSAIDEFFAELNQPINIKVLDGS